MKFIKKIFKNKLTNLESNRIEHITKKINNISIELNDKVEELFNLLLSIKELSQNAPIDNELKKVQQERIQNIITNKNTKNIDLDYIYIFLNEEFGGSFGMLTESSKLHKKLCKYTEINQSAKNLLRTDLLNKFLINKEFVGHPKINYIEKHGGPIWFDIEQFKIIFLDQNLIQITIDNSLSKSMTTISPNIKAVKGKYNIVNCSPNRISGQIKIENGENYDFETLKDLNYIFLENKQNINESFIIFNSQNVNNFN